MGRFGVNRDLSYEPPALIILLDKPVAIANHENKSLEMQIYGFDKTMAPQGKGVIKVELVSSHSYWKELYAERKKYDAEKQKVAQQVIDVLEHYFMGDIYRNTPCQRSVRKESHQGAL